MNFRSKKASVAVYALLSVTIFTAFLFSLYVVVNSRHKAQLEETSKIRQEMEDEVRNNEIEIVEDPEVIDLHDNPEYNDFIDSNDYKLIKEENKIYKFTDGAEYINYNGPK